MALPCLNCGNDVAEDQAKIFAGVFCCPVCHELAERLERKIQAQLKQLYTMTRESIRIALVEGKLHFGNEPDKEISKTDLLKGIMQLEAIRDAKKTPAVASATGPDGRPIKTRSIT